MAADVGVADAISGAAEVVWAAPWVYRLHKPRVDPSVKPVQQKFWHPPLAMREPIAKEIDRLLSAGVIERIESSPWISNM